MKASKKYIVRYQYIFPYVGEDEDDPTTWKGFAKSEETVEAKSPGHAWQKFCRLAGVDAPRLFHRDKQYEFPGVCAVWRDRDNMEQRHAIVVVDTTADEHFFGFLTDWILQDVWDDS